METKYTVLIILLVIAAVIFILWKTKTWPFAKKEGFEAELYFEKNPQRYMQSPPSFAAIPVAPRSTQAGLLSKSVAQFEGPKVAIAPVQPVMMPDTFAAMGGGYGGAPGLQNKVLTSSQADQMLQKRLNGGAPELPAVSLPLNNIEFGGDMDPANSQNFMFDRTIFAPLKRRYGNQVDFFRGDVQIKQQNRGWFDISPATEKDIVVGYFDRYIDTQQTMAINDATFTRSLTPAQQSMAAVSNVGINAVAYANI